MALLLLIAVTSIIQAEAFRRGCSYLSVEEETQMGYFEKLHEGMNLRSDCEMMREAYRAAGLLFTGAAYNYDPRWCQYSRWFYDTLHIMAVKTRAGAPAYKMPWKKINQTSKLHPKAKYGCAYRSTDISKFGGALYLTICLYERNPEETRCFCN